MKIRGTRDQDGARNPWWVVLGSALALTVGNGPIISFTFGIFLKPIINEFGWNRATVSLAYTAFQFVGAFATPFVGKMIDRWGVRRVTLAYIAFFSLAVAGVSLTPPFPSVFILLYAICGVAGSGQAPLPYSKIISAWFEGRRGLALGIAIAGVGLGTAIIPQFARMFLQSFGWRGAYVGLGVLTFGIAFPAVFFLVREPERSSEVLDASSRRDVPGLTMREAINTSSRFWFLTIAIFIVSLVTNGIVAHLVPLLTDRGMSIQLASIMLTLIGLAMIGGRVFGGLLLDRFFAPNIAVLFFLLPALGILMLSVTTVGTALAGTVCVGLSLGSELALLPFFVSRYFGLRSFGEICGYLMAAFLLGAGLGPWLMGLSYDLTHSYTWAFGGFGLALVCASLLISRLGPYAYPAIDSPSANYPSSVTLRVNQR